MIKTLRDAEIEVSKLQTQLSSLRSAVETIKLSTGLSEAQVLSLIKQNPTNVSFSNTVNSSRDDTDSVASEGYILHNLGHRFVAWLESLGAYFPGGMWHASKSAVDGGIANDLWFNGPSTPQILTWFYTGPTGTFLLKLTAAATEALSNLYFVGVIGGNASRVEKLWLKDLDVSGTVTGISGVVNSNLEARSSGTLAMNTTFTDIPNCSVSLNVNGVWEVKGTFCWSKSTNDTEVQGQLLYDGAAQTEIVRLSSDSTATNIWTTEKTWYVTVSGQPKTAKIQAKKTGGTGTTFTDVTNCAIKATYLHT